ncbi:tetratricopeptide repeat protein [Chitinophaga rhizosphaerae]|uniref:tetratricopeptide repeat protein n=1 Tax=Chitinophaga rhizosphaerae TaxID=1864947 RepID=UPI000F80D9AB|nr:tetratricopeptide repeat protein [Chitinophaga rhizosphaerae]
MEWQKAAKKWTLVLTGVLSFQWALAQDNAELQQTARNFLRTGDYANAILVLNQAITTSPDDIQLKKDLAFAYYLRGDYQRAYTVVSPLVDKKDADIHLFQIAGNIYQGRQDWKGAEKVYQRGLRKFPKSGELHCDYGDLLQNMKNFDAALRYWVKGIEVDPNFPGNYYHAARSYMWTKEPIWAILYGETFINLESYTTRTAEIRDVVLECYKKLFDDPAIFNSVPGESAKGKKGDAINDFMVAFKGVMAKNVSVIATGIEPQSLIMLRTRFLLDWYKFYGVKYPYALFDFQRKLLRDGMFESYNYWLFGPAANQSEYKSWTALHKPDYDNFTAWQRNHPLKLRDDEFYNTGKIATIK